MRLTDLWQPGSKPTVSFELFPARSDKAAEKLPAVVDELAALSPDFVSVTFGAGGSTREGSYQLIKTLKQDKGLEVLAYFACYGLGPQDIKTILNSYQSLGIENILAVRGDAPREEGFEPHPESLWHASDLLTLVKSSHDFCLGAAGYPEGHVDAPNRDQDLEYLKLKVDRGAEFIITNYFYDNVYFYDFIERCHNIGIEVPILPGVMPIYSVKMMEMLAGLCGATIPEEIRMGIASLPEGDKAALNEFGISFAVRQCTELIESGIPGLHIYTMDRCASAKGIVSRLRERGLLRE